MDLLISVLFLGFLAAALGIIAAASCVLAALDNLDASKGHSRQHDGQGVAPGRALGHRRTVNVVVFRQRL